MRVGGGKLDKALSISNEVLSISLRVDWAGSQNFNLPKVGLSSVKDAQLFLKGTQSSNPLVVEFRGHRLITSCPTPHRAVHDK